LIILWVRENPIERTTDACTSLSANLLCIAPPPFSKQGHVYSLIVDMAEWEKLRELQAAGTRWETEPGAVRVLNRLERRHIVPPSREGLRLVRGLYQRTGNGGCSFAVSPFIVARRMDWRNQHRLLVGCILSEQHFHYQTKTADILRCLLKEPRTEEQLRVLFGRRRLGSHAQLRRVVEQLKQDGVIVICDSAALHEPRSAAGAQFQSSNVAVVAEPAFAAAGTA
jgi:hypothetical protein